MATIYKEINSSIPVVLTAQVFADDIEIHPDHRLRDCTRWQWYFDGLLGSGPIVIPGATARDYTVDLSSVAFSGEYYCEISIGTTGECDQTSPRERISIIECLDQTDRTFLATGASGQVRVRAPHYEMPIFSTEGTPWITLDGGVICNTEELNVCLFVQNFSLSDQSPSSNSARRGQMTSTVGTFVCFYNIVQDYIAAPPMAPEPDPAPGPFINLSQNGPSIVFFPITVTAEVGTIGGLSSETYTVAWQNAVVDPANDRVATVTMETPAVTTVTATVTSSTGGSATTTIDVEHTALTFARTMVVGDIITQLGSVVLWGQQPPTTASGTFTVSGGNTFFARLSIAPEGYLGGRPPTAANPYQATLTINGPGVSATEIITATSGDFFTREIEYSGSGEYNWTFAWSDGLPRPSPGGRADQVNQSNASVFFAGQLF